MGLTFEDRALQMDHGAVSILAQRHLMRGAQIRHGKLSFDLGPTRLLALRVRIANGGSSCSSAAAFRSAGGLETVLALFSDNKSPKWRRVSMHWFAGVLQSLYSLS
jgi:hypothetical protein